MRNYDLSVLFDSAKGEEDAKKLQTKLEDVIKKSGGTIYKSEFILQFRYNKAAENESSYLKNLNRFCNVSTLLNSEPSSDNKSLKLTFDIVLKEEKEVNKFVLDISNCEGVSEVSLVAAQSNVDY